MTPKIKSWHQNDPYRLATGPKRPGILTSNTVRGQGTKPEVRGGLSHHLAASRVQQPDQANPGPTQAGQRTVGVRIQVGTKFGRKLLL